MQVDMWFPTVVYTEGLKPPPDIRQGMLDSIDKFHSQNPDDYTVTGDVVSEYQVAKRPEFSWLNKEVGWHCYQYLKQYGLKADLLNIFVSKSWPVVCNPAKIGDKNVNVIQPQNHMNSHLSVVYYLQSDPNGSGGELTLHSSPTHPLRYIPFAPLLDEVKYQSLCEIGYPPIENQLIIFPSSVEHEVTLYHGDLNRYSITYDIIVTCKEELDDDNEMCVMNPNNWMELIPDA